MDGPPIPVTFGSPDKTVQVAPGTPLMEAAAEAGINLDLPCGGEGVCGKCRVIVRRGAGAPSAAERRALGDEELRQGWRLACQSTVRGPMTVEVPETSVLASFHKILVSTNGGGVPTAIDPVIRKEYVELPPPRRGDDVADLTRVERAAGAMEVGLDLLAQLPGRLRQADFRGTLVTAEGRLLDFEPGDTRAQSYAVAVDVGTTTLAAILVDLNTGEELTVASRLNPQTGFGDDVITRIQHAVESRGGLQQIQQAVTLAIDEMVGELVAAAGIERDRVYEISFSGNTTMQHLLLGINPRFLGESPFVPPLGRSLSIPASDLGIAIHPRGRVYVQPVIGGFVGGDTVSGILATGMTEREGPSLLVDIGTNGEVALWADGKLRAAATAAGPAFEGARITHGMRGSAGAIERVVFNGRLETRTIGGGRPIGLCGSGLIDLAAEMLRHGMLSPEGRMRVADELPGDLPADLRGRVVPCDGQVSFLLASERESSSGRSIVFTQRDVRQLQLASGAIRAGIAILLKRAGLEPADLKEVLIAGGFGNFIRRSNAQRMGLIPGTISRDAIRYQGNTSLAGARLVLLSEQSRRQAEELASRTEHLDLAADPGFQWTFADAMIFPEEV